MWGFTWEGDKLRRLQGVFYEPAIIAAVFSEDDVPIPPTLQLPALEPHPSPTEPYGEKMALWGAGEFRKIEMLSSIADAVDDLIESVLPDVLKAYQGVDAVSEWIKISIGRQLRGRHVGAFQHGSGGYRWAQAWVCHAADDV